MFLLYAGWSDRNQVVFQFWLDRSTAAAGEPDPQTPPLKTFNPKNSLPALDNYVNNPTTVFWQQFPFNNNRLGKSPVSATRLRAWANAVGCEDWQRLDAVCRDILDGANIGCKGAARNPTVSGNAPSAHDAGAQVTDAVAEWVKQGIVAGPFDPADRPPGAKVNGVMCRIKPNGTARIILNLSAPKGRSVNDGITADDFPTTMSSTGKWLAVLDTAGRSCLMAKIDWASAYKHLAVRAQDLELQFFNWLGKDFIELMLIFGGASSAGLYDRLAKTVLDIVVRASKFPPKMVIQYLDDVCAAAPRGCSSLSKFVSVYREIAEEIGVQLAPLTDPDKAFNQSTQGVVLGVHYDTVSWTWSIPQEKLARVLSQIRSFLSEEYVQQHEMWSLVGRILHYAPLVPSGKFNIGELIIAGAESKDRYHMVHLKADIKRQLYFWWLMLKTTSGLATIPAPDRFPAWTRNYYTDASGGSALSPGHGTGGIGENFWFLVPWGSKINSGTRHSDGRRLSRKMSALELVGPLICVAADQPTCRGLPMRIWVDNAGSVAIWRKGYSTRCGLCTILVKAISRVAAHYGSSVNIEKITRCSNTGAELADELSKGRFEAFKRKLPDSWTLPLDPAWIPPSILLWIANPSVDHNLGDKILHDIAVKHDV
jgi:hypothetical protein